MAVAACELHYAPVRPAAFPRPALRLVQGGGGRVADTSPAVYWLRRAAVMTLLALVVGGAGSAVTAVAGAVAQAGAAPATASEGGEAIVVVGRGETIWDAVGAFLPTGTSRHEFVAEVVATNGVDAAAVTPGTRLRLPRR